ncbi:L-aspartate oxidase [Deinobacterium chartae]|uniref:L-aspartate oxidase n=1 Tax=Deinobacterium chartae TaxID=521158 RepID=A0A841I124_9DEIO|nr:L-aspartate oxidase [Deinobacterium chartae]MBB6097675.1 L-aspartate oxidase [Deinobacterium chartae]
MKTDLLIIGGGIAGSYAALKARAAGLRVVLACKSALEGGSTRWAQGGIAAPLNDADNAAHLHDTLAAGRGLCDPQAVRVFVDEARARLEELYVWGVPFAHEGTLEGGHGQARVRHAYGDATGLAISEVLSKRVRLSGTVVLEGAFARRLMRSASGRVCGAELESGGELLDVEAGATLLASGGMGRLFGVTTAPPEVTGDGLALAYRAGAELRDLEFVQFHPTVFVHGGRGLLVSEAARGEGGVLLNAAGERFMERYDPLLELAPRDVVARAIASESARGQVFLDLRHLGAEFVSQRFPSIRRQLLEAGTDIARQPVPVRPAVHYTIGGVTTDLWGRTTVPGLYAAGEVASSGLHGANRLASNSLSEGLVFGARAVRAAADELVCEPCAQRTPVETLEAPALARVREILDRAAGIVRSGPALEAALSALPRPRAADGTQAALEGGNLALLARLLLESALSRRESRGAHWREDHPETGEARHTVRRLETALR